MARLVILVFLSLMAGAAYGQPHYFRHYQVENGLSNNAVICSIQDRNGFLWFGTKDGLDRFDGYSFKVFRNDPDDSTSIGSNFIHSLYLDNNGTLWIGTEKGIYRHDAKTERFNPLPGYTEGRIRDILMDTHDNLWFISGFTLFTYDLHTGQSVSYDPDRNFEATAICRGESGIIWAATTKGALRKLDPAGTGRVEYDLFKPKTLNTWIEKIYPTADGMILAGTSNHGVKLFDTHSGVYRDILTTNPDGTAIFARNFIQTAEQEYWIGTESGIFIYDGASGLTTNLQKRYNDPYSISDNAVYTFCKDKEGGVWAGTYFGGINYYPRQYTPFSKYFPRTGENSISGYIVREIHEDHAGNLWIGTEDAGLNKLDTAGRFTHFEPADQPGSISYTNIHGLLVDGGQLWIGTFEHGLDIMDLRTNKVIRHYGPGAGEHDLKSNFIYCIYRSPDSSILLGTTTGAYRYDRDKKNFSPLTGMPFHNWYSSLLQDSRGVIWAGTYGNGVHYYDPRTGAGGNFRYSAKDRSGICANRINSIFEDSRGWLWFATEGGLCRFDTTKHNFVRYTTRQGLPTDFILSMLEDEKGRLWISTSKGLVSLDPLTGHLNTYSRINGLLSDQFNFSSAYKDHKGRMYFGSVRGMTSFLPSAFVPNGFIPPVYITGFQVDGKDLPVGKAGSPLQRSISYADRIELRHDQSSFSIDFAALSFTAPEMAEYAYRMEGLDKDWTFLKTNRKAYFTRLSPGDYIFHVKASNSSGIWNVRETLLTIHILPPWWASPMAWCCYILAAILGIYHFVRNYHQRVEDRNRRRIEILEAAKEKEIMHAKIEFFTNVAHEIRTPLTLIKAPLEKVIKKTGPSSEVADSLTIMNRNTERLIHLTNQLLDFRQAEIKGFSLSFVQTDITGLLEDTYANFKTLAEQKALVYELHLPTERLSAYIDIEAFNKIVSNLFSNAIKYAGRRVSISLLPFAGSSSHFTIEIGNDGPAIPPDMREKIFEPFFRLKGTEKQKGTGIGLALSRSLTQLHKGTLLCKAGEAGLNIFTLTMPVHQLNEFNLTTLSINSIEK